VLKLQHIEGVITIKNEINYIESELDEGILSINTSEAALHINRMYAKK